MTDVLLLSVFVKEYGLVIQSYVFVTIRMKKHTNVINSANYMTFTSKIVSSVTEPQKSMTYFFNHKINPRQNSLAGISLDKMTFESPLII